MPHLKGDLEVSDLTIKHKQKVCTENSMRTCYSLFPLVHLQPIARHSGQEYSRTIRLVCF